MYAPPRQYISSLIFKAFERRRIDPVNKFPTQTSWTNIPRETISNLCIQKRVINERNTLKIIHPLKKKIEYSSYFPSGRFFLLSIPFPLSFSLAPLSPSAPSILPPHPFIAFPHFFRRSFCHATPYTHAESTHSVLRTSDVAHRHPYHNQGVVGFYSNELLSDTSSTTQTTAGIVRFRNRAKFRKLSARWTPSSISFGFFLLFLSSSPFHFSSPISTLQGWKRKRKRERSRSVFPSRGTVDRCIGKRGWYRSVVKHRSLAANFGFVQWWWWQPVISLRDESAKFRNLDLYSHELSAILKSLEYEAPRF